MCDRHTPLRDGHTPPVLSHILQPLRVYAAISVVWYSLSPFCLYRFHARCNAVPLHPVDAPHALRLPVTEHFSRSATPLLLQSLFDHDSAASHALLLLCLLDLGLSFSHARRCLARLPRLRQRCFLALVYSALRLASASRLPTSTCLQCLHSLQVLRSVSHDDLLSAAPASPCSCRSCRTCGVLRGPTSPMQPTLASCNLQRLQAQL